MSSLYSLSHSFSFRIDVSGSDSFYCMRVKTWLGDRSVYACVNCAHVQMTYQIKTNDFSVVSTKLSSMDVDTRDTYLRLAFRRRMTHPDDHDQWLYWTQIAEVTIPHSELPRDSDRVLVELRFPNLPNSTIVTYQLYPVVPEIPDIAHIDEVTDEVADNDSGSA